MIKVGAGSARKVLGFFLELSWQERDMSQLSYNQFFCSSHTRSHFLLLWLCDTYVDDN